MLNKLFRVYLDNKNSVVFRKISAYDSYQFYTVKNEVIGIKELHSHIFDFPSTNGLYTLYGQENNIRIRLHVCTESFMDKYYNDQAINTMTANPNVFYRGKYVNIKTFVKKQLLRALIPSKNNDVQRVVESYEETFKKELSAMSVVELRIIMSNKGYPSSNLTKANLIKGILEIYQNG